MPKKLKFITTDCSFTYFAIKADQDYIMARLLNFCGSSIWHGAAYHSHQALEKYIKAYLVQERKEYLEEHNLKVLGEICAEGNNLFKDKVVKDLLEMFDQFEQVSRYGNFAKHDPLSIKTSSFSSKGVFVWTDMNIKFLDKLVFKIRSLLNYSDNKGMDYLQLIIDENHSSIFTANWRLPGVSLKQVLTSHNDYYK